MGDWIVRYHSSICFDTPYGIEYSEDDQHLYLYHSKNPRWRLEVLDTVDKMKLSSSLKKAVEWLRKA